MFISRSKQHSVAPAVPNKQVRLQRLAELRDSKFTITSVEKEVVPQWNCGSATVNAINMLSADTSDVERRCQTDDTQNQ